MRRGQGTFEYILLLGGAVLVTAIALVVLTTNSPGVDEQKQCAIAARQDLACFYANGTFRNESKFTFKGQSTPCNCTLYNLVQSGLFAPSGGPKTSVGSSPSPTTGLDTCFTQGQGCNPSASTCCTGLSCTGGLPLIGGETCQPTAGTPTSSATPNPTASASATTQVCQNTPASCGQNGACQDCTLQAKPTKANSAPKCEGNQVVHDEYGYTATCTAEKTCSWTENTWQVTEKTCAADEACNAGNCVKVESIALVTERSAGLSGNVLAFAGSDSLTAEEQALKTAIEALSTAEKTIRVTPVSDGSYEKLKDFKAIAVTDNNGKVSAETIDKLLTDGRGVLLFNDGIGAGGSAPQAEANVLQVDKTDAGFLEKFDAQGKIKMQEGTSYYISSMPAGWARIGIIQDKGFASVAWYADKGIGRGAALGFEPAKLAQEGKVVLDEMLRWVLKTGPIFGVANKVVLITGDYNFDDKQQPLLSLEEEKTKEMIEQLGLQVELVPMKRRFTTDFSNAKAIVVAQGSGFPLRRFYEGKSKTTPIILVGDALGLMRDTEQTRSDLASDKIYVRGDIGAFTENYDGHSGTQAQEIKLVNTPGQSYGIPSFYASEFWTSVNNFPGNAGKATAYVKTESGVRSAMFGHKPTQLTDEGKLLFSEMMLWATRTKASKQVTEGKVALLTKSYQENPQLSLEEQAAVELLKENGLEVEPVSQKYRFVTDFSKAKAVLAVHWPGFTLKTFYGKVTGSAPTILAYEGGIATADGWGIANQNQLNEKATVFKAGYMNKYDDKSALPNPAEGVGNTIQIGFSQSWTAAISNPGYAYHNRGFFKETNGKRASVFGYNPAKLSDEGKILFHEMVRWTISDNTYKKTIEAGKVALLLKNLDGSTITANEQETENQLQTMGLSVERVPQKLRFQTDFSKAAFLVVAESPELTLHDYLASLGKHAPRVLLLYGGGKVASNEITRMDSLKKFMVDRTEAFLMQYIVGAQFAAAASLDTYGKSGLGYLEPDGWWKAIGRDNDGWWRTAMYASKNNGECGAFLGYAPASLSENGKMLLGNAVRWLRNYCYLGRDDTNTPMTSTSYVAQCYGGKSATCENTATFSVPNDVSFAKAEFVQYHFNDNGLADLNGNRLVGMTSGECDPGKEVKGGCYWTGSTWVCGVFGGGGPACPAPSRVQVTGYLTAGTNNLKVSAVDVVHGDTLDIPCTGISVGGSMSACAKVNVYTYANK